VGMAVLKPEHALKLDALAPEVLRLVAGTFSEETSDTKLQLLTSVTKQRMRQLGNPMLAALHRYVVELARCAVAFPPPAVSDSKGSHLT
jgi:hypothetical protein